MSFINDCTRFTLVYFMKNRSDLFKIFKNFYMMVDNQFAIKIKTLHSSGEYISYVFEIFPTREVWFIKSLVTTLLSKMV